MRTALATLILGSLGCTGGYRAVNVRQPGIEDVYLLGFHTESGRGGDDPRWYVDGRFGALGTSEVDSAAGRDEWSGLMMEAEGGRRFPLLRGDRHDLSASLGGQFTLVRSVVHEAGPSGEHNHYDDDHEIHRFVGGGLAGRLAYAWRVHPEKGGSIGADVGAGVTSLGGLGMGTWIELGLLVIRW